MAPLPRRLKIDLVLCASRSLMFYRAQRGPANSESRNLSVILPQGLHKKMVRPLGQPAPGWLRAGWESSPKFIHSLSNLPRILGTTAAAQKWVFRVDETIGCDITFVGQGAWPTS